MKNDQGAGNLFIRFSQSRELAAAGVKTEAVGRKSLRLTRSGRMLGIWQEASGGYSWYPIGQTRPQTYVFTVDEAIRHATRTLGGA